MMQNTKFIAPVQYCKDNLVDLCKELIELEETGVSKKEKNRELARLFQESVFDGTGQYGIDTTTALKMAESTVKLMAMQGVVEIGQRNS